GEAEVTQAYQGYQAQFVTPARAELTEILVPTEAEGRDLAAKIRSGADMADLSRRYSRRARPKNGPETLMLPEGEMEYGKVFHDQVLRAEAGKVVGPVAVEGGYSIFRVERRIPAGMIPLDQARDVLIWRVKKHKAQEAFNAFLRDLRERSASQVKWNDKAIEALAATGAW
ncbi:MAG: peptidyl-prolyl cis-trans isomerase, partial [Candidatus Latescibacterota bacterium]